MLKPIVTVNADAGINYVLTTNNPTTISSNKTAVKYKDDVVITYSVDNKYVLTAVNASGTKDINIDKANSRVVLNGTERPTSVGIHARLKQQNISFNANGGSGTMETQVFEHSIAQALKENNFINTGYLFTGWNTMADGSGTAYADKQSVTFAPASDGQYSTLYAQWTECTSHVWEEGKCTECGKLCSHSGGSATCDQKATCGTCGEKYGEFAEHKYVYEGLGDTISETCTEGCDHSATAVIEQDATIPTMYTGSAIEALKVTYSTDWKGGNLSIAYADNTNVGTASGQISIGEETAAATFDITKATPDALTEPMAQNSITYGDKLSAVHLTSGWNWIDGSMMPTVKNEGYKAFYTPEDTANYDWTVVEGWNAAAGRVERKVSVEVKKAALTVTANDKEITYGDMPSNAGVTYSGFVNEENEAVLGGTLDFDYNYTQYAQTGVYDITPKGLTADNYEIAFEKGKLTVGKATPDIGVVSVSGVVTDKTKPEEVVLARTVETVPGTLKIVKNGKEFMQVNKVLYDWEFVPEDTDNYNVAYGNVQIDVQDTVVPEIMIKVDTKEWKEFLNTITFGHFFTESQKVTITYADNENGSGLKETLYYVAESSLSESELETVEWNVYTDAFDIEPDSKYVIYAKATDNDGNTIFVNSDGIVIDEIPASIEGISNESVYYGQVLFNIGDELSGIKKIEIDGVDKTHTDGQYVISPDNMEHTIVVTDKAGNVIEYKIKVYKNYTVIYKVDDKIFAAETVGYGKDTTLPEVPVKDGYTGKWNHDGKNITADTEIKAVYTKKTVTISEKEDGGAKTGDNSRMTMWFVLTVLSSVAMAVYAVGKRRKHI